MTEKLYLEDMYQKEFTAKVIDIQGNKVVLDRTCFYIQGGGQSGDAGEINGIKVIDTQKGGFHILAKAPDFKVGDEVTGKIDWNRRYRTMRLHSASHIVEHFLNKKLGENEMLKTNVNHKKDLTDYQMEMPSQDIQEEINRLSNDFISRDLDIKMEKDDKGIYHWSSDEIQTLCAGTHVKNTSEIGEIKVTFENKGDSITRVIITLDN